MNILAVDDNPDVLRFLESTLSENYSIKTCESVREASKTLTKFTPDLLILDIVMNEIDGQVFAELVRELHPEIKILMITGNHGFLENTVDRKFPVLYKPIMRANLIKEVEKVFNERKK